MTRLEDHEKPDDAMMQQTATPDIIITRRDKERLRFLVDYYAAQSYDAIVEFLDQEISRAVVVEPEEVPRDVATMNSRVRYRDNMTGEVITVSLVYPGQEDSVLGRISVLTPVAMRERSPRSTRPPAHSAICSKEVGFITN